MGDLTQYTVGILKNKLERLVHIEKELQTLSMDLNYYKNNYKDQDNFVSCSLRFGQSEFPISKDIGYMLLKSHYEKISAEYILLSEELNVKPKEDYKA